MECNQAVICGRIIKLNPLRYTPAGVAVLEFTINHASMQKEAGIARQSMFDISTIAIGPTAMAATALKLESLVRIIGFLNKKSHSNQQLIFHATQIETL